ncbi:MAG: SIR2 family protein [Gammaproteobacteria bacterium]
MFGAGISYDANIPLMYPLTERVNSLIEEKGDNNDKAIISALKEELTDDCHVEHYLSHLGDLIALAERSKFKKASLNSSNFSTDQLNHCYREIVRSIGVTVRYGYKNESNIGTIENPIIDIKKHMQFVRALFEKKVNFERRSSITFFTTNYDTLLEDALALNKIDVIDGFSGGAMAFWNANKVFNQAAHKSSNCVLLYKLHGSVDWHRDSEHGLVRARYGTKYLSDAADIMIYPQATKYVETQKDPFAALFSGLRYKLRETSQNVLVTCGYSFSDEHINSEIEYCLEDVNNKTTVVAFTDEKPKNDGSIKINKTLDRWLEHPRFGARIYVAGKNGLYNNSTTPLNPTDETTELSWWSFSGLINFIKSGEP